jgi:hypothetical protein
MKEQQDKVWDVLVSLDSVSLLEVLTNYHGMQLLDEGFAEHLIDEGFLEPDEEEPDEEEAEEPQEGDYIIADGSPLGSITVVSVCNGRWADGDRSKAFTTEDEAVKAIKEDMYRQKYWPNVWRQDDHGGIGLYDMEG